MTSAYCYSKPCETLFECLLALCHLESSIFFPVFFIYLNRDNTLIKINSHSTVCICVVFCQEYYTTQLQKMLLYVVYGNNIVATHDKAIRHKTNQCTVLRRWIWPDECPIVLKILNLWYATSLCDKFLMEVLDLFVYHLWYCGRWCNATGIASKYLINHWLSMFPILIFRWNKNNSSKCKHRS